jgi:hypothetical protein|tara:strand:+ start:278 stop:388 length:111 start_codon:yes stop_codon:yes gene_type:complete
MARRGGASLEYIKNLVLKYMELEDEEHEVSRKGEVA